MAEKVAKKIVIRQGQFNSGEIPFEQWLKEKYPNAYVEIEQVIESSVLFDDDSEGNIAALWEEFIHI